MLVYYGNYYTRGLAWTLIRHSAPPRTVSPSRPLPSCNNSRNTLVTVRYLLRKGSAFDREGIKHRSDQTRPDQTNACLAFRRNECCKRACRCKKCTKRFVKAIYKGQVQITQQRERAITRKKRALTLVRCRLKSSTWTVGKIRIFERFREQRNGEN